MVESPRIVGHSADFLHCALNLRKLGACWERGVLNATGQRHKHSPYQVHGLSGHDAICEEHNGFHSSKFKLDTSASRLSI